MRGRSLKRLLPTSLPKSPLSRCRRAAGHVSLFALASGEPKSSRRLSPRRLGFVLLPSWILSLVQGSLLFHSAFRISVSHFLPL